MGFSDDALSAPVTEESNAQWIGLGAALALVVGGLALAIGTQMVAKPASASATAGAGKATQAAK